MRYCLLLGYCMLKQLLTRLFSRDRLEFPLSGWIHKNSVDFVTHESFRLARSAIYEVRPVVCTSRCIQSRDGGVRLTNNLAKQF